MEKPIDHLSRQLSLSLTKLAKEVTPQRVHRLRTTIRRVETLVASFPAGFSKKQETALDTLAALRRRAGQVRDFDVQLDLLGAIANGSAATDRATLADSLQRKREKRAARLRTAIEEVRASKFAPRMRSVFEQVSAALPSEAWAALLTRAQRQLAALGSEFAGHPALRPSLLHGLRIQLKKIRYLVELGEESREQQDFLSALKQVQEALGVWHDWEELAKNAEKQFGDRAHCPLLLEIRALFAAREASARAAVAQLFAAAARKQPRPAEPLRAPAKRA